MSRHEAFFRFLEWYSSCLKETSETGCSIEENSEYDEINSCEELMLKCTMKLMYWKRWDGERWVSKLLTSTC